MKMKKILSIAIFLLVSGCNSGNYQEFAGGVGYQSSKINNNEYNVSYTGTQTTDIKKVNDFVLLRSAELTLEKGYKYFVITDARNNRNEVGHNQADPSIVVDTGPYGIRAGSWANASGSIDRKSELTIMLFNEKPDTVAYDAEMINTAIRNEYSIGKDG